MTKRIEVNLSKQELKAFDGKKLVYQFDCVTGGNENPTIPGTFNIRWKDQNHFSSQFHVPMHYAMFFDHGKAIHQWPGPSGLFWAVRLGKEMFSDSIGSHGCVRLTRHHAETLFNWAQLGTIVKIT